MQITRTLKQTIRTIKSTAIITVAAVLLVACGGGGGGSSATGPSVSAFSHNAYTFAPDIAGDTAIGISFEEIGRVFPNDNVVRGLVARVIGETDPKKISALAVNTNYRVSYSIDAVAGSSTATFFSIDATSGLIRVSNPAGDGSGLTYDEIRAFVGNSITVKLTITVINPQPSASNPGANLGDPIESSVRVNLLNADAAITDTTRGNVLSYNRGAVSFANSTVSEIELEVEGTLNENNQLSAEIPISGFANNPATSAIINRYSITRNDPQSAVTIFYGLRTPTDEECANGAVYIDNNDLRIKAGTAFDYETDTRIYNCRLAASVDGVDYYPLAFVVNDNAGTEVDSLPARQDDIFQIKDQANPANGCSGTDTACYYGDVTITIEDVNESPTVELVGGGSNFGGSAEGVGVLSTYVSVTTGTYSGTLATDGAKVDAIKLRINDEDSDQTTVGEVSVAVAPNHRGIGAAFSVQRPSGNNPGSYELVVNTTLLDYEAFSPAQLTADDKAIYKLTITARDNRTSSLANTETFNFEVKDVEFTPVFVDPSNIQRPLQQSEAFVKEANIINGTAGTPLYLLSGVRAFERHRIGRLAAVDPETGSGNDLTYTIVDPRSTVIHSNLQLIANGNNLGRRLIVAGGGLTETATETVNLQVAAPSGATRTLGIMLAVDNSRYADEDLVLNPADTPDIIFNSGISLVGSAAEESPASDNVIIAFRNTVESPPVSVDLFNTNSVITKRESAIVPSFALLTARDFTGISSALGSFSGDISQLDNQFSTNLGAGIENFVINSTDGRISVRPGTGAFSFPAVFTLPVLVTPAVANQAPRFIAGMSDITIVTIATTDVNTPPQASAGRTQLNLTNRLTAQVNENLPAGTELARFTITDDNQAFANSQPAAQFSTTSANTLLLLDTTRNPDGSTAAIISSRIEFDYENPTHRSGLQNLVIRITDAGSYTLLDPTTRQLLPAPIATNTAAKSLEVAVEITLQDAIEAPVLEAGSGTDYSISESAGQNAPVAASDNQVVAMLSNPLDFPTSSGTGYNASRMNFSVSGDFSGILNVVPAASPNAAGALDLRLTVADPVRLENLGDGRTLPVTITARDSVSRRVGSISIDVTITNDPANSNIDLTIVSAAIAKLANIGINEQDVVGRSVYPIPTANFSISITDLAKDADEFFRFNGQVTSRRLVEPLLSLEDVSVARAANLNPAVFVSTANILRMDLGRDDVYSLTLTDTDFVESALFGDINFNLVTSARGTPSSTPRSANIQIVPAAPKNVVYANAARAAVAPPVYALSYTQTPYAEPVANISEVSPITIDATTAESFSTALRGVAADSIKLNVTDTVYRSLALRGASGRFIARNPVASDFTAANPANTGLTADNKIVINFANNPDVDLSSGLEILRPDAQGNLVAAGAATEFYRYFDLEVNNTVGAKRFIISQKVFTQSTNASLTYNALDTLQLYEGAKSDYTFNYFLRARVTPTSGAAESTGASNYALAQFSVAVEATGGNDETQVKRVALVTNNANFGAAGQIILFDVNAPTDASIALNQLAVNSFSASDAYDLLVEFENPDAAEASEIASDITIAIPQGNAPAISDASNLASNGGLIDLKLSSTDRVPAATITPRTLEDEPSIAGATFASAEQTYTRRYDFALAQNLYGEANIIISVQDKDATGNLGMPSTQEIALTVTPPTTPEAAPISYTVTAGGISLDALQEDIAPLTSTEIPLTFAITDDLAATGPGIIRGRVPGNHLLTGVTNANNPITNGAAGQNPLNKDFITAVSGTSFTYVANGWGVQNIAANVVVDEPRGFAGTIYARILKDTLNLAVTSMPDATTYDSSGGLGILASGRFSDGDGNLLGNPTTADQADQNIFFQDNDLLFDTLASVLGTQVAVSSIPLSTSTATNGLGLEITNSGTFPVSLIANGNPITTDTGTTNLVRITIGYSLSLTTQDQLDVLLSREITNFPLSVAFNNANTLSAPSIAALNVAFTASTTDPTIATGIADGQTLAEDDPSGTSVAIVTIADPDIARQLGDINSIYTLTTPVLTRLDSGANVADFLQWGTIIGDETVATARATLSSSRALTDTDVGSYSFTWTLTDNRGSATGTYTSTAQTFTLTVTRVEDAAANGVISFTNPGSALNTNNPTTGNLAISLTFVDDDLAEPGQASSLTDTAYTGASFVIDQPDTAGTLTCNVAVAASSKLLADLNSVTYAAGNSVTARANLANGALGSSLNLGHIKAATNNAGCADPLIGSTITQASFTGVMAATAAQPLAAVTGDFSDIEISPAYIIRGYRTAAPELVLGTTSIIVPPGSSDSNIVVTVTDGDPDDGVPHNPTLDGSGNVVRASGEWAGTFTPTLSGADCVGVSVPSNIAYIAGSGDSSTATITITAADGATGPCTLNIPAAGEDGIDFAAQSVAVTIAPAPTVSDFVSNNPDLDPASFSYDSTPVSVSWTVRDNSPTANTITQTLVSSDTSICSVANPTPSFVGSEATEDFSSTVDALSPGTCTLTITSTENSASNDASTTIVFPNLSPTVTAASLSNSGNDVDIGSGFSASGHRANAVDGSFVVTINAANRDPGDDDSRDPDVSFTQTGGNSCTITESITSANYANSIATAAYTITNPTGGACGEITISVNEEDVQGANQDIAGTLVIPENTFIFDAAPTLNRPDSAPVFAGYAALTTFSVSVSNNDNGAIGTSTVAAAPTGPCTAMASAVNNGIATITVTPTATNAECSVAVTATEDGLVSNVETFSFTLSEIAPLISIAGQTSPYTPTAVLANGTITITLTATKQDISNTGVGFAVASNPGGCDIAGFSDAITPYTGSPFSVPLTNTATATQELTISLPADRLGQGDTCEIDFTATENGQVSAPFRVIASFIPPRIVRTAGVRIANIPAISGSSHEITVTATKQEMSNLAAVTFTATISTIYTNNIYCNVVVANPTASYVGGGAGGIGSMATTKITISFNGPLGSAARCGVNVAVTEGAKTDTLPVIPDSPVGLFVSFTAVNQPPLLVLSDVPTGTPFPDERLRIGVQVIKQDDVGGGIASSEVMVINGVCMATLDGEDISYRQDAGFGVMSSIAYYNIILDAANAVSAIAADRQCEIEFSVTETETRANDVPGFSDPVGAEKTTNRTIVFDFGQEKPPLFTSISTSSGSSVTSPSNRDVLVDITLQKQDASNTRDITLPDTINSAGDVCTAVLRDPARYAATAVGSLATGIYAVRANNLPLAVDTACGAFVFTATEGSSTETTSTASASPAITFTPSTELPPAVVVNTAASTLEVINAIDATLTVTITKQDNGEANLAVTGIISEGSCSIREITNTGYGENPVLGSVAAARYKVTFTGRTNIDTTCTVSITATEDSFSRTFTQEVIFNTVPTQVSFADVLNHWSALFANAQRIWRVQAVKEDTTDNLNLVAQITNIMASNSSGALPAERCNFAPLEVRVSFSSPNAIEASKSLGIIQRYVEEEYATAELRCTFTISADVDGDAPDSLPPTVRTFAYDFGPGSSAELVAITTPPVVETAPLFVSVTSDSPVIVLATGSVDVSVSVQKRDNSNTLNVTLPPSINSAGDVCTATLTNPARYAVATAGSVATTTYRVELNDRSIGSDTSCGSFTFTATEDGEVATTDWTEVITFLPALPPVITARAVGDATQVYSRDSLEVEITATKQDDSPTLNVTFPSAIDSLGSVCTATLTASTQYSAATIGSVATASYDVTINDSSITSATPCGSFTFTATEDGEVATADWTEVVTFFPSSPPVITARVIGSAVDLPADATAMIEVTATKQDPRPTLDVTFLSEVVSFGACRATLVGSTDRQYDGVIIGSSSVTVSYSVTVGLQGNCGTFSFTATENELAGRNDFASGISFAKAADDEDSDGIANSLDVDDDGDGLIEIVSAVGFNLLRNNLAGTGLVMEPGEEANSNGCPSVGGCKGYELMADIDLAAAGYDNWNSIGRNPAFTATFDGNGFKIYNLKMQLDTRVNGWGLFGNIQNAVIRNAHVRNVNITYSGDNSGQSDIFNQAEPRHIGGLIGFAEGGSMIINNSVTGHLVAGAARVGGLVGYAIGGGIISSYVELEEVNATSYNVGGLVGEADEVTVRLSYALTGKVTIVGETGGGLVGRSSSSSIESSMAIMANITTQNLGLGNSGVSTYGGLAGESLASAISFTAGITGNMLGDVTRSGGLVGFVRKFNSPKPKTTTNDSYVITQFQTLRQGNNQYGGLVGVDSGEIIIGDSYWDSTVLSPVDTRNLPTTTHGQGQPTTDLQGTTTFTGIYETWGNGWCDATTNEFTTNSSSPLAIDANRFWDLGTATEYPAMNCLPNFTPAEQRAAMAKALNGESPARNLR